MCVNFISTIPNLPTPIIITEDLQPKLQVLRRCAEEIRCEIQAEEVAEDMLRVGQLVSATSFEEEHWSGSIHIGKHRA